MMNLYNIIEVRGRQEICKGKRGGQINNINAIQDHADNIKNYKRI
jgi:hypothetical protein